MSRMYKRGTEVIKGNTLLRKTTVRPIDIPDLEIWYDFSDASTVTLDTGKVSQILDKSGNNRTATQTASAQRFTYPSTVVNGHNTAFVTNSVGGYSNIRMDVAGSSNIGTMFFLSNYSATANFSFFNGLWGHGGNDGIWGLPSQTNLISTFENLATFYSNGNQTNSFLPMATHKVTSVVLSSPEAQEAPYKLGQNNAGSWGGDIGEVVIYNRVLTKTERWAVQDYLIKKWGI